MIRRYLNSLTYAQEFRLYAIFMIGGAALVLILLIIAGLASAGIL